MHLISLGVNTIIFKLVTLNCIAKVTKTEPLFAVHNPNNSQTSK